MKLKAIRVKTGYWRPGTDYVREIVDAVDGIVKDGDIVTVSEKALSTAKGLLVDESTVIAGWLARFLSSFWMRKIWGGPLGALTKLREHTLRRLRNYPFQEGAAHKQVALMRAGLLQALRHYSEGGIDASNLPYSLVSLPLGSAGACAEEIRLAFERMGRRVTVVVVDGDTTCSRESLHLSPRRVDVPGLVHVGGFLTFVLGRALGFRSRSTPIAVSGSRFNPDWVLTLANVAHRVRGHGAGRTVWDMVEFLGVGLAEVSWEMLERINHYPIVVLRELAPKLKSHVS
ncbi:MAG: coenzyme F420-0:L-glutamate ligase [Candidatus Bathyarchaeota archaeon]|nr:MAG: coenzyme F420-0:L-glutamate ligase [Candidatus Bathyarchaeota archaeon]